MSEGHFICQCSVIEKGKLKITWKSAFSPSSLYFIFVTLHPYVSASSIYIVLHFSQATMTFKICIFMYLIGVAFIKLYTLKRYSQNTSPTRSHLRNFHLSLPPLYIWTFPSKKICKLIWSQQPSCVNGTASTTLEICREPKKTKTPRT